MIEYSKSHNNLEIMNGAPEITNVIEERNGPRPKGVEDGIFYQHAHTLYSSRWSS